MAVRKKKYKMCLSVAVIFGLCSLPVCAEDEIFVEQESMWESDFDEASEVEWSENEGSLDDRETSAEELTEDEVQIEFSREDSDITPNEIRSDLFPVGEIQIEISTEYFAEDEDLLQSEWFRSWSDFWKEGTGESLEQILTDMDLEKRMSWFKELGMIMDEDAIPQVGDLVVYSLYTENQTITDDPKKKENIYLAGMICETDLEKETSVILTSGEEQLTEVCFSMNEIEMAALVRCGSEPAFEQDSEEENQAEEDDTEETYAEDQDDTEEQDAEYELLLPEDSAFELPEDEITEAETETSDAEEVISSKVEEADYEETVLTEEKEVSPDMNASGTVDLNDAQWLYGKLQDLENGAISPEEAAEYDLDGDLMLTDQDLTWFMMNYQSYS